MRKYMIAAAFLVGLTGYALSEQINVPEASNAQPVISADYGGVSVSSAAFTTAYTTASVNRSRFYGANFSSGTSTDFVDVWDSSSVDKIAGVVAVRVYNVSNSTGGLAGAYATGFSGPRLPLRFKNGIIWKASSAAYNAIHLLFWSEQ